MGDEEPAPLVPSVSVHEALSAVMGDVQAVGKGEQNKSQGFSFRGIDAVVNAVGPALRRHGVIVLPNVRSFRYGEFSTRSGTVMHTATLEVEFTFVGPDGSTLSCSAMGESADAGDKATAKAHSVAFRTALLQALCIPTDEPDPDSVVYERAAPPTPISKADAGRIREVLNAGTKDDRAAWLDRFRCPPAELPLERLADADDFLSDLTTEGDQ